MIAIPGLPDEIAELVTKLASIITKKRVRNELRDAFMDGTKRIDRNLLTDTPDLGTVLGWPAKAVETLARRCRLQGFTVDGGSLSDFGIDTILDDNQYLRETRQGHLSSLVHAVSFEVVTSGGYGEPDVLITRVDAKNGTGVWSERLRRLTSFLSVFSWDASGVTPRDFALYLPDCTWTYVNGALDFQKHNLGRVPVEPFVYKPRLGRPFGASRITRTVMFLTQSAMRVVLRSEATAQLYSAPGLIALGLSAEQIQNGSWLGGIGNVVGIPDADEMIAESPSLARAQIVTIQQASQEPHISQLRAWAQLFSGETSIPVSSLGISSDGNPTSADSYAASREDLIAEAEDAGAEWGGAHRAAIHTAYCLREGIPASDIPSELRTLRPLWRDPRYISQAAAADAMSKLAAVIPGLAETDAALDMLGLDESLKQRLIVDLRRSRARASIAALSQG